MMKMKMKMKMASVIALALVLVSVPAFASVTETVTGGYTVGTKNYDLIKGVFYFPSAVAIDDALIDIPARFFYTDGFFAEDPYTYNNHLATASICMAMSAFYSNEGDYPTKRKNITQYMKDIGVNESDIYANRYNTIKPQTGSIGVTIGMKTLSDGRVLIPVAIRGSNYELEWASNVMLGESGEAQGFGSAGAKVFGEVQRYIARKNLQTDIANGNVVFWVAGYSRAGAATNLTAKRLVDEYSAAGNKIFAYGLEPAIGGVASEEKSGFNYSCIHSVVNRADLVPRVAPSAMGFKRYGTDHYIPGSNPGTVQTANDGNNYDNTPYKTTSSEYQTVKTKMLDQLLAVNPIIRAIFTDTFTVMGLGLNETQTGYTLTPGESIAMEDYLDEFMTYLPAFTGLTRTVYTGGAGTVPGLGVPVAYGNVQRALRMIISILFGGTQNDLFALLTAQFITSDSSTLATLATPIFTGLTEWYNPAFSYKPMYINRVINFLEKRKITDALRLTYPEKEKLVRAELPVVLNLVLTAATGDLGTPIHGTIGFTQIATLIANIGLVGMNHYPEVTFSWLRAQDSLYDNETVRVSAIPVTFSAADSNVKASDEAVIVDIDELPDFFAEHGESPAGELPSTVTGTDSTGTARELSVTWGNNPKVYAINDKFIGDTWTETSASLSAGTKQPLLYVFSGTVSGGTMTISADVSTNLTANVYVAGLPRVNPPYTVLPEGEYSGPQSVVLRAYDDSDGSIEYRISRFASSDTGTNITYSGPVTIGSSAGTSAEEYALVARVKSSSTASNDSAELVWYYKINPALSEDTSSIYVSNTASKIFTLTNDTAVCWSVDVPAGLNVTVTPSDSAMIPAKRIDVAVVTIAGETRRGTHTIPVKISADGSTWTDKDSITFQTSEVVKPNQPEGITIRNNSSGNCNMSLPTLGLLLALSGLILRQKKGKI